MPDIAPTTQHLPRPKGLPPACSDESYYLGVRAWATGHSEQIVAEYLCVPVKAVARFVGTREWYVVWKLVREEYDDYEIVALSRLHSMALKIVADALDRGDPYVDMKTGEVRYKRISGRDATTIAVQIADQKHLVAKRASNAPDDTDVREELLEIAKALRSIRAKEIEGEVTSRVPNTTNVIDINPRSDETTDPD